MASGRMRRVGEAVREVLSVHLAGLKDPRVGFVTVTAVDVSPDLRHARVWVSVLGSPEEREQTLDALNRSHGFLQARLGEELHMKRTPVLQFGFDETMERARRIDALLEERSPGADE